MKKFAPYKLNPNKDIDIASDESGDEQERAMREYLKKKINDTF